MPTAEEFEVALATILRDAEKHGRDHVDVTSGDLHRRVGGYPGRKHRMPACCGVMRQLMRPGDQVLQQPESGQGASLAIRYCLPR